MELTLKSYRDRLNMVRELMNRNADAYSQLEDRLLEKGVEYTLVMPMVEVVMGFDPLQDICYEMASEEMNNQRFDFLIDQKLLIEAKRLGAVLDEGNIQEQIRKYIRKNQGIDYGILTNGVDWEFWLHQDYIARASGATITLPGSRKTVKALEVGLSDFNGDQMISVFSAISRDNYETFFRQLAKVVARIMTGGKGKIPKLHDEISLNKALRQRVEELVAIKKGAYYDALQNKKIFPGDRLCFEGEGIKLTVEVTDVGSVSVVVDQTNILDYREAMSKKNKWKRFPEMLSKWESGEGVEYMSPLDILKEAKDRQRINKSYLELFSKVQS